MIFADKLIQLRKKNGWSQEDLAEKMGVTRQSVSKWEGAQAVPDLGKMVKLSQLFGVSTDYLLKDEIETEEFIAVNENISEVKVISMEEANSFLSVERKISKTVAFGAFLCIISPICLFILMGISETKLFDLSENAAIGIGMSVLLILVAIAVAFFISSGSKTSRFEYIEKEVIETEYGVNGMVNDRKEKFRETYNKYNIIGACFSILSVVSLFAGMVISDDEMVWIVMLSFLLLFAGIGVTFFVRGGIIWSSFEKLLQEGDYTKENKKNQAVLTAVSVAYWLIATAIYLAYSFITDDWKNSWIIWPVVGVLFPAVVAIFKLVNKEK